MKRWLSVYIGPPLAAVLIRLIGGSLRVEVEDRAGILKAKNAQPFLIAFWHNRILMLPYLCQKFASDRRFVVMISRSRDGQLIADVARRFGVDAARGSTSKGGSGAFRKALRELVKKGSDVGVTPDGPRGPRYEVQPGVLALARMSGLPIVPITVHYDSKWELPSWDRFQIPHPFTRCRLIIGEPMSIEDGGETEALQKQLAERLGD